MGDRNIHYRQRRVSGVVRKRETRALVMIICAVVLPLILAFILIAADMRTDLSDLIPSEALSDPGTALIGWRDLEIPDGQSMSLEQKRWQPGRRVRMLGYMLDGYGKGLKTVPRWRAG